MERRREKTREDERRGEERRGEERRREKRREDERRREESREEKRTREQTRDDEKREKKISKREKKNPKLEIFFENEAQKSRTHLVVIVVLYMQTAVLAFFWARARPKKSKNLGLHIGYHINNANRPVFLGLVFKKFLLFLNFFFRFWDFFFTFLVASRLLSSRQEKAET